ncbi:hypothetical protein [Mycobacterium sp. PS03-16]|uniref:hypothetical protein n=1 Tax=Mycobacterium sp. PS03-16 TaxID=2559611 RepID=UPI001FD7C85C|nr:hypothetical protein [Mycobacterium sp. PS03-16]
MRHDDPQLREVVRFAAAVAVLAGAFLALAAVWVSTCGGSVADALACGPPQRTALAAGAPVILLAGALWAFVRGHQNRRRSQAWWTWQVAGLGLIALTLLVAATSMPGLAGPAVLG